MKSIAMVVLAAAAVQFAGGAARADVKPKRILVLPYANEDGTADIDPLTVGVAAFIVEVLRTAYIADRSVEPVHGSMTFLPEQARLTAMRGQSRTLAAMNALAVKTGADFVLSGGISGPVHQRIVRTDIYAVTKAGLVKRGQGSEATINVMHKVKRRDGTTVSAVSMHLLVGGALAPTVLDATTHAMAFLPESARKGIKVPPTDQARAFLQWSRALIAYFGAAGADDDEGQAKAGVPNLEAAQRFAAAAAHVDPAFVAAQRMAGLVAVERAEKMRADAVRRGLGRKDELVVDMRAEYKSARERLELALKVDKNDVPSLAALGLVEMRLEHWQGAAARLEAATRIEKREAGLFALLSDAYFALRRDSDGIAALEKARDLDQIALGYRRALASRYADAKRYKDAAAELAVVVGRDSSDAASAFDLGANLREAGEFAAAKAAYESAATRFQGANATLLRRFARDAAREAGSTDAGGRSARLAGVLSGKELKAEVTAVVAARARFESDRRIVHFAANDVVNTLLGGEAQCAAAARVLARARQSYKDAAVAASGLSVSVRKFRRAIALREHLALTPDARRFLETLVADTQREIPAALAAARTAIEQSAEPAMDRYNCQEAADGGIASADEVRSRNERLTLVEASDEEKAKRQRELQWRQPYQISPAVKPAVGRTVRITVDNTRCAQPAKVFVNGTAAGTAAAKGSILVPAMEGDGSICIEAPADKPTRSCKESGAHRRAFFTAQHRHVVGCSE